MFIPDRIDKNNTNSSELINSGNSLLEDGSNVETSTAESAQLGLETPPNATLAYELSDCKEEALLEYNLHNTEPVDEYDEDHVYSVDADNDCHLEDSRSASESAMIASETLPAGTLIIAMDEALQDGDEDRVREAYGLAVHLLHAEIPLKWIINSNKTSRTQTDFSASARRKYPTISSYSTRNFRSGPIAIFPGFEAEANTVINNYGNGIRVYELQSATTVDVATNITHKPKVLVEPTNSSIHTGILSAAGLSSGTHYNTGSISNIDETDCITVVTIPHNEGISGATVNGAKAFLQSGGNLFAQCAAIRSFQQNSPRLFTDAGYIDNPGIGTFIYSNPTEISAQFEGNMSENGGSVTSFGFATNPPLGTIIVGDNGGNLKAWTGIIDGAMGSTGGYVHYLAGHTNSDQSQSINADRFYLNAILRPSDRPMACNLNLGPIAVDDSGTIDCGTSSITINVLANDTNPLGGTLTVSNLGTGSQGTFVNNNDGTVTYTPNSGAWNGPDVVTYEACSGAICSEATLTISGGDNIKIGGTVFVDSDQDAFLDMGESGPIGVTVNLYDDVNNNDQVDGGDTFLESQNTTSGGVFQFLVTDSPSTTMSSTISTSKATSHYE
ncbi:MAG: hypothetical protein ACJATI_005242, partial [Halioglobus sp.]